MLRDLEKREIEICEIPNAHLLILGKSGAGKTFFLCRKIEEKVQEGKNISVFDFSCSYSLSELRKCKFRYVESVKILNPFEREIDFTFGMNWGRNAVFDSFINALRIGSYYQKKLLQEAILGVMQNMNFLTIPLLMDYLEAMLQEDISSESKKNIGHILTRLAPYSDLKNVRLVKGKASKKTMEKGNVTIVQLSDFPVLQRKFLTELLTELFWCEVRGGYKRADIVLFDEFQNMRITPGSALSAMLREGRKFGLGVYLSTQFLGNYDQEAVDTLMQAGNMLFFKPAQREMKFIASLIDPDNISEWRKILNNLQVGEAVLKGRYRLNSNLREIEKPIVCRVESI